MSTLAMNERFWNKADRSGGPDSCWLWHGATNVSGYGAFVPEHKAVLAHRFALGLSGTDFGPGDCVLHRCDTPLCVNPAHLWVGDRAANNADRHAKGRDAHQGQHGEANPGAKLTTGQVLEIRRRVAAGELQKSVAADLDMSPMAVSQIVRRTRWAHV